MNKIPFYRIAWMLTFYLFMPQAGFSECCESQKSGCRFYSDLLFWTAHSDGIGFTTKPSDVLITDNFTKKSVVNPTYDWRWGYRVGGECKFCCLPLTIQGSWIYLKSKAHGQRSHNSGPPEYLGIYPIWSMNPGSLASDYVSSACSHWHLTTNIVDLNFQYDGVCPWHCIFIKPFLGVRFASLNQKLSAKYEGGIFYSGQDYNQLRCRFYGLGPRFGVNGEYELPCGFSIIGRAAFSPLYGRFRNNHRETYLRNAIYHRSSQSNHFVLSTDFEIGIRWKGTLVDCFPNMIVDVAWEGQEFFSANRFNRGKYHFFSKNRALFLQGLTISTGLNF